MGAAGILGVIDVHGAQALDTHHTIELVKHTVKIADDVIAGVIHMAGVQTHAQLGRQLGALVGNASMMSASSSKLRPTSVPLPAMVSSNTVVCWPSNITWHRVSTII